MFILRLKKKISVNAGIVHTCLVNVLGDMGGLKMSMVMADYYLALMVFSSLSKGFTDCLYTHIRSFLNHHLHSPL